MLVRDLEAYLLDRYPKTDAEAWDHVGLSVGNPDQTVSAVLCALDATEQNVRKAQEQNCNVLLTHHPVYIQAPDAFTPSNPHTPSCSAAIYTAAKLNISIISLHTNLDRSLESRTCLSKLLGIKVHGSLEHPNDDSLPGLGLIGSISPISFRDLVRLCSKAFETEPRAWGNPDRFVQRIAVLGGSLGSFGENAVSQNADVIICGEAGYHTCQDLMLRGASVILLGHDMSELPFVGILANAVTQAGIDASKVNIIDGSQRQWWTGFTQGD